MFALPNLEAVDTEVGQDGEGWRRWEESVVDSDNKHGGKE